MRSKPSPEAVPLRGGENGSVTPFLLLTCMMAAIGGLLFGYDTGIVSGAIVLIRKDFDLTDTEVEVVVSVAVLCAALSALAGSSLNARFGRKPVICVSALLFLASSVLIAAAPSYPFLVAGRALLGLALGASSMTVPMYISEAAPARYRGTLVTINSLFITGGQAVAGVVAGVLSERAGGWRVMIGIAGVPALVLACGFALLPESPRWLVSAGRDAAAGAVLRRMRGSEDVDEELRSIVAARDEQPAAAGLATVWHRAPLRRAVVLGCMLQLLQQLTGINVAMYYSASSLQMAGFAASEAIWLAAGVAAVNFVGTLIGFALIERVGRRRLLLASAVGVAAALGFLGAAYHISAAAAPAMVAPSESLRLAVLPSADAARCAAHSTCLDCVTDARCGACVAETGAFSSGPRRLAGLLSNEPTAWGRLGDAARCALGLARGPEPAALGRGAPAAAGLAALVSSSSGVRAAAPASGSSAVCLPAADADAGAGAFAHACTRLTNSTGEWHDAACPGSAGFLAVLGLSVFLIFFAPGLGTMPWVVNSEIFPLEARALGQSLSTTTNWFFNFVVSMTFLSLTRALTPAGAFWCYGVVAVLGFVYMLFFLPETKGRSLEEVEGLFDEGAVVYGCGARTGTYAELRAGAP